MALRKKRNKYPNRERWKNDGQRFYRLSEFGHDPDREHEDDRCFGYLELDRNIWKYGGFCSSEPINDWGGGRFVIEPGTPLDDMPGNTKGAFIVSTRLKELIERHAPGQAQYLPISVTEATWDLNLDGVFTMDEAGCCQIGETGDYWIMNTLREVDCMDWPRAEENLWGITIQADKVPDDVLLFRLKGRATATICRRRLRELCDEAGIRGPQFREALHV